MATLREKIQVTLERYNGDSEKAALEVCLLLEDEIGLAGNGWFDDDEAVGAALANR